MLLRQERKAWSSPRICGKNSFFSFFFIIPPSNSVLVINWSHVGGRGGPNCSVITGLYWLRSGAETAASRPGVFASRAAGAGGRLRRAPADSRTAPSKPRVLPKMITSSRGPAAPNLNSAAEPFKRPMGGGGGASLYFMEFTGVNRMRHRRFHPFQLLFPASASVPNEITHLPCVAVLRMGMGR